MSYQSQLAELKSIIEKIEYYKYTTNSLIYWDKITYMPKNAIGYRSKVIPRGRTISAFVRQPLS